MSPGFPSPSSSLLEPRPHHCPPPLFPSSSPSAHLELDTATWWNEVGVGQSTPATSSGQAISSSPVRPKPPSRRVASVASNARKHQRHNTERTAVARWLPSGRVECVSTPARLVSGGAATQIALPHCRRNFHFHLTLQGRRLGCNTFHSPTGAAFVMFVVYADSKPFSAPRRAARRRLALARTRANKTLAGAWRGAERRAGRGSGGCSVKWPPGESEV